MTNGKTITQIQAEIKLNNAAPALLAACKAFAAIAARLPTDWSDDRPVWEFDGIELTAGDFRRVAIAAAEATDA